MIDNTAKLESTGRMPGQARREQILEIAVGLFSQYGFKGATTKKIAEESGISEAMLFKHFATKHDLYGAILDAKACNEGLTRFPWESNENVKEAIEATDDHAFFFHMALNALEKQQADESFLRLMFYAALEEHELAERFFSEFVTKLYEFIGSYIAERQIAGAMRQMDPRIVVRAFLGMIIHHSLNNILWDKKRTILNISNEDAARNFAEIILNGVSKR